MPQADACSLFLSALFQRGARVPSSSRKAGRGHGASCSQSRWVAVMRLCASAGSDCRKAIRRVGSSSPKTSSIRWMGVCPVSSVREGGLRQLHGDGGGAPLPFGSELSGVSAVQRDVQVIPVGAVLGLSSTGYPGPWRRTAVHTGLLPPRRGKRWRPVPAFRRYCGRPGRYGAPGAPADGRAGFSVPCRCRASWRV